MGIEICYDNMEYLRDLFLTKHIESRSLTNKLVIGFDTDTRVMDLDIVEVQAKPSPSYTYCRNISKKEISLIALSPDGVFRAYMRYFATKALLTPRMCCG